MLMLVDPHLLPFASHQNYSHLNLQNLLLQKCDKVKDLEVGKLSWIIWIGLEYNHRVIFRGR